MTLQDKPILRENDHLEDVLSETFVFRDFETSRIDGIRRILERSPYKLSFYMALIMAVWVGAFTISGTYFYHNSLALNNAPNVASVVLVVGLLIYPITRWWIPVLFFLLSFFAPIALNLWDLPGDVTGEEPNLDLTMFLLAANILVCGGTALLMRMLFASVKTRFSPITSDLVVAVSTQVVLTISLFSVAYLVYKSPGGVFDEVRDSLGLTRELWPLLFARIFLAGVAATAFLIAVIQRPTWANLGSALSVIATFIVYGTVNHFGFTLIELFEVVFIIGVFALIGPMKVVTLSVLIGISLLSAMNGVLLGQVPPATPLEESIWIYAIVGFALAGMVMTGRSYQSHINWQRNSSLRRLNSVRKFAGVGLFSINIDSRNVRFDNVTQQIFRAPPMIDLANLMHRFPKAEQKELRKILFYEPGETGVILTCIPDPETNAPTYIRLFIWYEKNSEGRPMVYGLAINVTGEHLQERALTEALDELAFQQRQQAQMFSIISHEIRSPAAVISMLAEDIEDGSADFTGAKKNLRDASDQLLSVLSDMRQAVNPEKNLPINKVPFSPEDLTTSVRNTYAMIAENAGLEIRMSFGRGARDQLIGDATRLKQVLGNIIRNAIIHSRGTRITVIYSTEYSGHLGEQATTPIAVWTISDNGVGIPDAEVQRLFEPFERGKEDPRNSPDGSGLGLYIVKTSIELLGGKVTYFHSAEGGAGYRVSVPAPYSDLEQENANSAPPANFDLSKLKILLVEDTPLVAEVIGKRLNKTMGTVRVVPNGRRALEELKTFDADVVVTDLFMPEMPGDELCATLRNRGFDKPIIGLTAAAVGTEMAELEKAGASIVMAKPLDMSKVISFLQKFYGEQAAKESQTPEDKS